jgi:elongation factor 1-alpha
MTKFYKQPPEIEEGNREYKLKISPNNKARLDNLASQMKYRLYEGDGKALYIIGIEDDGEPIGISKGELNISIDNIKKLVKELGAKIQSIRYYQGKTGNIATVRVTRELEKIENKEDVLFIL